MLSGIPVLYARKTISFLMSNVVGGAKPCLSLWPEGEHQQSQVIAGHGADHDLAR